MCSHNNVFNFIFETSLYCIVPKDMDKFFIWNFICIFVYRKHGSYKENTNMLLLSCKIC